MAASEADPLELLRQAAGIERDDPAQAVVLYSRAAAGLAKSNPVTASLALHRLGTLLRYAERGEAAITAFSEAKTLLKGSDQPGMLALVGHDLGQVQADLGRFEAARLTLEEALRVAKAANDPLFQDVIAATLAEVMVRLTARTTRDSARYTARNAVSESEAELRATLDEIGRIMGSVSSKRPPTG